MKTLRVILAAFVIVGMIAGLTACGQTGPLYLPDKPRPASSTAPDMEQPDSRSR